MTSRPSTAPLAVGARGVTLLPALREDRVAVYVHFPWCLHRCAYCDFATTAHRAPPGDEYGALIRRELTLRASQWRPKGVRSVFFGGGTPSLWGPSNIAAVLAAIDAWSPIETSAEITLEANPGALESGDLGAYADAGINRVSIGVQATDDRRLRALDRLHDAAAAHSTLREIADLLAAGRLHSASADLLFGAPGQGMAELRADVAAIMAYDLPHLSAYALTVEQETPLAQLVTRGLAKLPDDDLQSDMLEALPALLAPWGLSRYEVSNFARAGHESRHNLVYWQGGPYLALGVGAHGFVPAASVANEELSTIAHHPETIVGMRYANIRSSALWMAQLREGRLGETERQLVDRDAHCDELMLTGLRLRDGVDLDVLRLRLGDRRCDALLARARALCADGAPLELDGSRLRVDQAGVFQLDRWLLALLN